MLQSIGLDEPGVINASFSRMAGGPKVYLAVNQQLIAGSLPEIVVRSLSVKS